MNTNEIIKAFKDFIEDHYIQNIKNSKFIEIDFTRLVKYKTDLADYVLDNPEESIKAIEIALNEVDEKYSGMQVLFLNLPESTKVPLNEVSDQLGRFLTFEGYVMKPSDVFLKCRAAKFECPSCSNIINIIMPERKWVSPVKCSCGRKGKFRILNKDLIKFQTIEIQEAMDYVPDSPRRLIRKKVFISENLVRKDINEHLQPGQKVIVHGYLETESINVKSVKGQSNEFKVNLVANNIIPVDNSWESIKLSKSQIKKIKEMAKKKDLLDEFSQSLAPSFEGYDGVRKSLILQHVGGKRIFDENGNLEERGIIHILMTSNPGGGKTYLLKKSLKISPLWQFTQGAGLTKAGLVACISKDEFGGYSLEVGPLVMADRGLLGLDEIEKMDKSDYGMLNNAMNDEQTKITKATIDQTLKTRTCVLATSNPKFKKFVEEEPIIKQLSPIPQDILDRFDIIWAMREKIDAEKIEDKYMARHLKSEAIKQTWTNEDMRNYISYARKLNPIVNKEITKYFSKKFKELTGKTTEEEKTERSNRLMGNILRLAYAHCKFHGVGKEDKEGNINLEKESLDFAFGLIRYSFDLLGLIDKQGFATYEVVEDIPTKKEVNKYYVIKDIIKELSKKFDNKVKISSIMEKAKDIDGDEIDDIIEKLKRSGDIFEPRPGFISLL